MTTAHVRLAALILILGAVVGGNTAPLGASPRGASQNPPPAQASPQADAIAFGPGRHRIGEAIPPGRFFSDPASGCYWERQSGTSGRATDTIAFGFVGFDAAQTIVDVAGSDVALETNAACGQWSTQSRALTPGIIAAGTWLVGAQVTAGTYRTEAAAGCYWERLRDFSGTTASVIASELVARAGTAFLHVLPGDAGIAVNAACGTWASISGVRPPAAPPRLRTLPDEP